MIRFMLDTDITSYLMKKNHPDHHRLMERFFKEEEGSIAISVMTLAEISDGIESIKEQTRKQKLLTALEYILSSLKILEVNDETAWHYGKIRNSLRKKGQDIGVIDTFIAAHAITQNITLVTNNSKHFQRVNELKIEHWI